MLSPNITDYNNYRDYLKDYYLYRKKEDINFTYKKFAQDAGIKSANFLKLVIDDKKNLTNSGILQFAHALQLSDAETCLFEVLIHKNQSKTNREEIYYTKKLNELKKKNKKLPTRVSRKFALFNHQKWPAILSYLSIKKNRLDSEFISRKFEISNKNLDIFLKWLSKEKILTLNNDGTYTIKEEHYIFREKISNVKLKNYLNEQLQLSLSNFDRFYETKAKFYSHTMKIAENKVEELQSDIKEFISKIENKYDNKKNCNEVIQINIQNFIY